LWGLLPDSDAVLRRWARTFSVSAASPFELLGTPVGQDCAGAFTFVKPDDVDKTLSGVAEVEWLTERQIAALLRELRADATAWLGTDPPGRFSLAGAQAKTALLWDGDRWGRPSGATATSHILKPAISGLDDHDLNEHLCLRAAKSVGLTVVDTTVQRFEDQTAVVVRRYDRVTREGSQVRVHQEDLCQALGLHPGDKYQASGGPSPKSVANLLRLVMSARAADDAVARFADALIWNWIIAGSDAHAKNYSLLLAGQDVRLAPLYDVASALPYDMSAQNIQLAMKFGGSYHLDARPSTWPNLAQELGMPQEALMARARDLTAAAPDAFSSAVRREDVTQLSSALPSRLVDSVAARAVRCATALTAG